MKSLSIAAGRAGTVALQIARADDAAWGQVLEAAARLAAIAVVTCFVAGEQLGRFVHQINDGLAAAYRCLLVGHQKAAAVAEQVTTQVVEQLDLAGLTVRELRTRALALGIKKAGGRRTCSATKAQLLAALA
jgi:hypothetical protein